MGIRWPVISSFFLPLSRGSFAIFLSPFPRSITSLSWVPLTQLPLDGAMLNFARGRCKPRQQLLRLLQFHPALRLLLQQVESLLRPSWHSLCAWMLALTLLVMSCVRWTPVVVVLHDDRLSWVVSRTIVLARLVMMRCLLDVLTLYHSWQKGEVVLDMRVVIHIGRELA